MELEIIKAIQRFSNPLLDIVMEGFTLFGEQLILAAVFCAVYWCFDKRLGRFLAVALGASVCLNGIVKDFFKVERIFGQEGIVSSRIETATGYSFPSGHTQTAAAFWGGLAIWTKKLWVRIALCVLICLIGFSRLYLGVHYPTDVLGGLALGFLCAFLIYFVAVTHEWRRATILLCVLFGLCALVFGSSDDTFKGVGMLFGILLGLAFEDRFVKFEIPHTSLPRRIFRYAAGMLLVGVIYYVPRLLLPHTIALSAVRYALTVFFATGFYPYLFTKWKI